MRGCQHSSIAHWLSARDSGCGSLCRPFAEVPERLQVPVDNIIDEHELLKGAVILGWTYSGDRLISYTSSPVPAADGQEGHHLQLWRFHPSQRAARLCNVPLFRQCASSVGWEHSVADTAASLLVTTWAAPDGSLIVVHGESAEYALNYSGAADAECHVTAISMGDDGMPLQAFHLTYHPLHPLARFQPQLQLASSGLLVLATSNGVEYVKFPSEPVDLKDIVRGVWDSRIGPTARLPRHILSRTLVHCGNGNRLDTIELDMGPDGGGEAFKVEPCLHEWVLRNLPGHQLTDYNLQFVALLPPTAPDSSTASVPAGTTAASEYDFVGSDDDDDHRDGSKCRSLGSSVVLITAEARRVSAAGLATAVTAFRRVCLLVNIDLATGRQSSSEVLSAADATPQQHTRDGSMRPPQQTQQDACAVAAAHTAGWRRRFTLPQDAQRSPVVLSNASVLATGQSLEQLRHPWLPMCLKGYKGAAGASMP